jgi:putative FmdB family regulatory protein
MPIYEYKCANCGYRFAMLEPLGTPDSGRECPICGEKKTTRVISTFSTQRPAERSSEGCEPTGG